MEEFLIIKYYFQLQLAIQLSALIVNTFEKVLGAKPKDNVQTKTSSFILQYKAGLFFQRFCENSAQSTVAAKIPW